MPSGAKKRKAAKKKMENKLSHGDNVRPNDIQETNTREIREVKVEDEPEINERNGKSCNGGSCESSSNGSSDDESRVHKNELTVSNKAPFVDSFSLKEEFDTSSYTDKYAPSYVTDSVLNENGADSVEDKVGNSAALKEVALEKKVDGTVIQSVKKNAVILDPEECLLPENNDNTTFLTNGVEHVKDSGVTEVMPCFNVTDYSSVHINVTGNMKSCFSNFSVILYAAFVESEFTTCGAENIMEGLLWAV